MINYEHERRVGIKAVINASRMCQAIRAKELPGNTIEKEDKTPVTVADFCTQAVISVDLLKEFPDDPIMAEENLTGVQADLKDKIVQHVRSFYPNLNPGQIFTAIDRCTYHGGSTGRFWVLDPVDGTKGFLRGDQYAIALALIKDGEVVLGILSCPNLPQKINQPHGPNGCIYVATKNQGTTMRMIDDHSEKMINVLEDADPTMAKFCESFEPTSTSHSKAARIAEILGIKTPPLRIDSQCKYGIVARGDASIYLRLPNKAGYEEKVWDHAAGWLIVKEAGGEVTDIYGEPLDFSLGRTLSHNKGLVASNGKLHHRVLSAVQQIVQTD
ncbi:MAG: 3'(2'),5'-bisphosphate nucleotidase [Candidatus Hodarchaeota archaeon]